MAILAQEAFCDAGGGGGGGSHGGYPQILDRFMSNQISISQESRDSQASATLEAVRKLKGVGDAKTSAIDGRGNEAKEQFMIPFTYPHE